MEKRDAPFDFFSFFDLIATTTASTSEKMIALVHARQIARKNGESYLQRSTAQAQASVSDNTYQRALPVVRLFLENASSQKRATTWRPRADITLESIEEAILDLRCAPKLPPVATPQNGVKTPAIPHFGVQATPQNGVPLCPKMAEHKEQSKEEEKKDTPKAPNSESVWLNSAGVPQVVNGKRVTLEKALAGKIDVDVFCEVAAPKVRGQADIWGTLIAEAVAFPAPVPAKRQRRVIPEAYSEDFEHFWKLYPRAVGKAEAFKSWQRLSLAQKRKAYSALKAQLPDLSARANDLRGNFCPHPSTWINGGRFDDEAQANGSAIGSRPKPEGVPDHVWKKIQEDEARAAAPK